MIITPDMQTLVDFMKVHAMRGFFDGSDSALLKPYFNLSKQIHEPTGTSLIFTRDVGMYKSGFLKNPDYDNCHHLSISFWDFTKEQPVAQGYDFKTAEAWVRAFYGKHTRYVWEESASPESDIQVRHYRVFVDPMWFPIIPRKEVYSKDFIEKGWKSWSDRVYAEQKEAGDGA